MSATPPPTSSSPLTTPLPSTPTPPPIPTTAGVESSASALASLPLKSPYKPDEPLMGGLEVVGIDVWTPWTGGKPKVDWSDLEDESKLEPISPSMYRGIGQKDAKCYQYRIKGLNKKLDLKLSIPLNTFTTSVFKHLKIHGMDTVSYLPDPGNRATMQSIVTHHTRFKLGNVQADSKALYAKFDKYDKANDAAAKLFFLDSLARPLLDQVEENLLPSDSFCIVWCKVMLEIHRNSHNFFEQQLLAIKNSDPITSPVCNPGQQMDKWVEHIRKYVTLLQKSGKYDHKYSEIIVVKAMSAGGDGNEEWRQDLRPAMRYAKWIIFTIKLMMYS